jgi:hypothetical protein
MMRIRFAGPASVLIAAVAWWGCASTKVIGEWRNPEVGPVGPYHKVFVAGATTQELLRGQLEDAFGTPLSSWSAKSTPSYSMLPEAAQASKAMLIQAVRDSGADAALVIRLVGRDSKLVVTEDDGPRTLWGGYRTAWSDHYSPVSVHQYQLIALEARVYDVASGKLVWTVSTETTDPDQTSRELADYARLVCKAMGKAGLLVAGEP